MSALGTGMRTEAHTGHLVSVWHQVPSCQPGASFSLAQDRLGLSGFSWAGSCSPSPGRRAEHPGGHHLRARQSAPPASPLAARHGPPVPLPCSDASLSTTVGLFLPQERGRGESPGALAMALVPCPGCRILAGLYVGMRMGQ